MFSIGALAIVSGCAPAAADIAKAISSENPVMREDGAKIAQNYDDPVVWDALVKTLQDSSQKTKLNAIESLAYTDAKPAGPQLIEVLKNDPDPRVKRAAADALGRLCVMESAPALVEYLASFSADDRDQLAGIWALGNLGAQGLDADTKKIVLDTLVQKRESTTDKYVLYSANYALRTLH
jgi:HEAT repeat protein